MVLICAPFLFNTVLGGKFSGGLEQLPLTLVYCTWFGTLAVAQNYLWCAEKAWLSSVALLVGLLVNVSLDLVLLPRVGLHGAVIATTAANFMALLLIYLLNGRLGMRIDRGTWILAAVPMLLWLGPTVAALGAWSSWASVCAPIGCSPTKNGTICSRRPSAFGKRSTLASAVAEQPRR